MTKYDFSQHFGSFIVLSIFSFISFVSTIYSWSNGSCYHINSVLIPLYVMLLVNCLLAPFILFFAFHSGLDSLSRSNFIFVFGVAAFAWNISTAVSILKDNSVTCSDNVAWAAGIIYVGAFLFFYPFEASWPKITNTSTIFMALSSDLRPVYVHPSVNAVAPASV